MPPSNLDLFDQWASAAQQVPEPSASAQPFADDANAADGMPAAPGVVATPLALRRALQELLKQGMLERSAKPKAYQQISADSARVNALLEPLDLQVRADDLRGLAYVVVADGYQNDDEDDWTHPLVRRQRLTLEQSLLVAILRREFLQREQEHGVGLPVQLALDSLLPQLEIYLGSTGSDMQERKRLLNLLDNLHDHGVVTKVDAQDLFTIRPMIVHLANPENLQALLQRLRELGQADGAAPEAQA